MRRAPTGGTQIGGRLTDRGAGTFALGDGGGVFGGMVLLLGENRAFEITRGVDGAAILRERPIEDAMCASFQGFVPLPGDGGGTTPRTRADPVPALSSRPGALCVVYLDFNGQDVTDPLWNGGATIVAEPVNLSDTEIEEIWRTVSEDFLPFNVDVTTVEPSYTSAAVSTRMRVIITRTKAWYTSSPGKENTLGTSKLASLTLAGRGPYSADIPCWSFAETPAVIAECVSHEIGHTLGLHHDGRNPPLTGYSSDTGDYYIGHGKGTAVSWGPIMGSSLDTAVTQWSRGEYLAANNTEDDIGIITGSVPMVLPVSLVDDHGLTGNYYNGAAPIADDHFDLATASATGVNLIDDVATIAGHIHTAGDVDVFRLVLSQTEIVNILAWQGSNSPSGATNLDIRLKLLDAGGSLIEQNNPQGSLDASIGRQLTAGTYYISVEGAARIGGLVPGDHGWPDYGSLGRYELEISVGSPLITMQPFKQSVVHPGRTIELSVTATGTEPLSYQWEYLPFGTQTWQTLSDSPGISSGATTHVLRLENISGLWGGHQFRAKVSNPKDNTYSNPSLLRIAPQTGELITAPLQARSGVLPSITTDIAKWKVSAGGIAVRQDGTVEQVDAGSSSYYVPPPPEDLGVVEDADLGHYHGLAALADGTVRAWGSATFFDQLSVPEGLSGVVAVGAGDYYSMAVTSAGSLVIWGSNSSSPNQNTGPAPAPVKKIVAARNWGFALLVDGTVYGFGENGGGAATGVPASPDGRVRMDGQILEGVVDVGASRFGGVALLGDGRIASWGGLGNFWLEESPDGRAGYQVIGSSRSSERIVALRADGSAEEWSARDGQHTSSFRVPGAFWIHPSPNYGTNYALVTDVPPTIAESPLDAAVVSGGPATFEVLVDAWPAATYQWYRNAQAIPGATNGTLTIPSVAAADEGLYTVIATNSEGAVSADAVLTVNSSPQFTGSPGNQTVELGSAVNWTASGTGKPLPAFQWRKSGGDIPGATGSTFSIPSTVLSDSGNYSVVISNSVGSIESASWTLNVVIYPPQITQHPAPRVTNPGQTATFTAAANGTAPLTYQWRKDGVDIPGAAGTSYTINNVQPSDAGGYSVFVTGPGGTAGSNAAQLTVYTAPAFITHPASQAINAGLSLTLTAAATGNPAPTYQWKFNGSDIPGATGTSHTINSVIPENAGLYSVAATNVVTTTISNAASIVINTPPAFTLVPGNVTHNAGATVNWSASATGVPTPTLQWRKNGVDIPGATGTAFSIASVSPADAGTYSVMASNVAGSVESPAWTLTVQTPPAFSTHPQSQTVLEGDPVRLIVEAAGSPSPTLQWLKGGMAIPGAMESTLAIAAVVPGDAGSYSVVATNPAGSTTSSAAVLTVRQLPKITQQPQDRTVTAPAAVSFTVAATATEGPLSYQWQRRAAGSDAWAALATNATFPNPHAATLELANTTTAFSGDRFRCRISDGITPAVTSAEAVLTVDPAPGAPKITLQPVNASATASGEVILSVGIETLAGIASAGAQADTPTYQWRRDGVAIAGATSSTYRIPSVQAFHAGTYSVVVTLNGQSSESNGALVTVAAPAASDARLMNLSTRALCQTGDDVLIPGFYVDGTGTKRLLMRAAGPELLAFGVSNALADPRMVLKRQSDNSVVASNDNWGDNANWQEIRDTARSLYAFGLTPGSKSAALLLDLPAGGYTIVSSGSGTDTGVAIVELYEVPQAGSSTRLINISNRGFVGTGGNIMIPGFVVSEEGSRTFLVRAVGPTLARFGVPGVLADPQIEIYKRRPGTAIDDLILTNDTWGENGDATQIRQTASAVHAFSLTDGSADAGLVVTLAPGAYTVNARGNAGTTGVALVEVYLVP